MMDTVDMIWTFLIGGLSGAATLPRRTPERSETGLLDWPTAILLSIIALGAIYLAAVERDIPHVIGQIVVAVVGGRLGASVAPTVRDRIERRKGPNQT